MYLYPIYIVSPMFKSPKHFWSHLPCGLKKIGCTHLFRIPLDDRHFPKASGSQTWLSGKSSIYMIFPAINFDL